MNELLPWWFAVTADVFEDGSLVIEDDTLDVDEFDTVNLRVKLGARPRSDVMVALSESSAFISLGDDELTFTQENWNTYQSVAVTGHSVQRRRTATISFAASGPAEYDAVTDSATITINDAFPLGSLVIEDDTLDVEGGGSVNLRVKLGARPRSDVTVALSETSTLISLGSSSLIFTRDNWDDYQSVTVTAAGNRQEFSGVPFRAHGTSGHEWWHSSNRPLVDAALRGAFNRYLASVQAHLDGHFVISFDESSSGQDSINADLSAAFESSGSVSVDVSGESLTVALAGADLTEPYNWTPSNSAEVTALYNALATSTDAADIIIRDYTPPDDPITISLSASGTAEYDGVTDTAEVRVT